MSVTAKITTKVTTVVTKQNVFDIIVSRKTGNVFTTINGVKVSVFRAADGFYNRLYLTEAQAKATNVRTFKDAKGWRIASPKAA